MWLRRFQCLFLFSPWESQEKLDNSVNVHLLVWNPITVEQIWDWTKVAARCNMRQPTHQRQTDCQTMYQSYVNEEVTLLPTATTVPIRKWELWQICCWGQQGYFYSSQFLCMRLGGISNATVIWQILRQKLYKKHDLASVLLYIRVVVQELCYRADEFQNLRKPTCLVSMSLRVILQYNVFFPSLPTFYSMKCQGPSLHHHHSNITYGSYYSKIYC